MISLERTSATAGHWTERQYSDLFQAGSASERIALVVEEPMDGGGSVLTGFLVARHVPREWELENLVVAPAARRRGLGRRLLDALLAKAKESHSEAVFLEARESNMAARSLYEKAGFEAVGRRTSYYQAPTEDAIVYRANLSQGPNLS